MYRMYVCVQAGEQEDPDETKEAKTEMMEGIEDSDLDADLEVCVCYCQTMSCHTPSSYTLCFLPKNLHVLASWKFR